MTDSVDPHLPVSREDLAAFVELKRPQLLAFIQHNLGPALRKKLEPDDILQEVVLTALGSFATFEVPGRDPFKLLCQLAEQRIIDAHRHHVVAQKRSVEREISIDAQPVSQAAGLLNLLAASMTSPSGAFSREQREFRMQQAVANLSADQQELLRLRFVEGLPTKEISARLGKSDGAIRVLLTRTLSRLQQQLSESA